MTIRPEILTGTEVATANRINAGDLVAEYESKASSLAEALAEFERAGDALESAATLRGTWGCVGIDIGSVYHRTLEQSLLQSAWRHFYEAGGFERVASADDKRRFERLFSDPPKFTVENLWNEFGKYRDQRGAILRGLAEVFSQLDPAFKSHEKMKVGVKGLPKRVILSSVGGYGSYGRDRLRDLLNALAAYQGLPLVEYAELSELLENGDVMMSSWTYNDTLRGEVRRFPGRGVWLKRFTNGNGHLFFSADTLHDINKALAEFYGDVLPDCPEERPARKRPGTDVARDLQFYRTSDDVAERLLSHLPGLTGKRVLEPSCGDGAILDALRSAGAHAVGCEVDAARAAMCEAKGHRVMRMNFLETVPEPTFDFVAMNPPFYGRHYAKHVRHALRFLKPGGRLVSILPATARHDHGELDDLRPQWSDLPIGSFSASGTNINTCIAEIRV